MRVGVVSAKGSPGVTTLSLSLAAMADGVVVEFDPSGGDVECWAGAQGEPGLIRVAAEVRHASNPDGLMLEHAVEVWPGVRAVLAPTSGARAESTLVAIGERLGPVLQATSGWVVVDGGRWSLSQVTARRLVGCDVVVLALSPTLGGVEHGRWLVGSLVDVYGVPVVVVALGDRPYSVAELADAVSAPVAGSVVWDRRGVNSLLTGGATRLWRRTGLARSARSLLERLDSLVTVGASDG